MKTAVDAPHPCLPFEYILLLNTYCLILIVLKKKSKWPNKMAKNGPDDFKAAKRAKIKVPIEAEFERRAALPSSGSHYVRWEESVCGVGGGLQPTGLGGFSQPPQPTCC